MTKKNIFQNKAFEKNASAKTEFHLVPQTNAFNALFNMKTLEKKEELFIEGILSSSIDFGSITAEKVQQDLQQIKKLTEEIKAIGRQGVILMGERVFIAREILKPYRDGTFTKWLETTFGSRKTGYNRLAYFELYKNLPQEDLKELFQKIPQRAAYILASREGPVEIKSDLIRNHSHLGHQELIEIIQKTLPSHSFDHKKRCHRWIAAAQDALQKIHLKKSHLSQEDRKALTRLKTVLEKILER